MLGYIGLAILLTVVVPTLCYFAGLIDLYLRYGAGVSGMMLLLWLLIDALNMRNKRVEVRHVYVKKKHRH